MAKKIKFPTRVHFKEPLAGSLCSRIVKNEAELKAIDGKITNVEGEVEEKVKEPKEPEGDPKPELELKVVAKTKKTKKSKK